MLVEVGVRIKFCVEVKRIYLELGFWLGLGLGVG